MGFIISRSDEFIALFVIKNKIFMKNLNYVTLFQLISGSF